MESKKENQTSDIEEEYWGNVVCFGTVIIFIAGIGHVNSFGLIYKDFIIETHSSAKSVTTAHGTFSIMLAIGGLLLNILSKKISNRLCGLIGAFIFCIGSFITIVISNTNQLPVTFGFLQGIGFGMMVPVCYLTINHYFAKKRTQAMSMIKAIQGFILIWYPQLIEYLMKSYGFRGTLLIIAGISLHTIPGVITMEPKKKYRMVKETAKNIENGMNNSEIDNLLKKNTNNTDQTKCIETDKDNTPAIMKSILRILNLKILKDPVFCNICIGQSFVNFSDLTFFILQPMLLYQYGLNRSDAALCISICAGADVTGRFALGLISSVITTDTRLLFFIATLFTMVARLVILQVRSFFWIACVTGLLGVLRALLHVCSPLVISDHVDHKDFTAAYALYLLAAGLINASLSPLIGLLKDVYQDYVPAFYALTFCCIPCLLSWSLEYVMSRKLCSAQK